ncbi:Urea-proton symporter DUR3 [Psilocybe cubensis]|uniref:Urea-proton symporter DUR3 n=1 Tax=Psilocybe cubensis TaxID=181762 RepID=A0ACB8GK01_PSICU|nr:Urea-proton symporter DUR3 [Psilocybe cubensis]KAH9475722.1 Urea-proton symporter DUR3 [Psilocybe cubensis]
MAVTSACSAELHKANIDLGWLFYVQGVVLSPAVIPIALTVTWRKLTSAGIIAGALLGASLGMTAWMIGCWKIYDPADYDFKGTRGIANLDIDIEGDAVNKSSSDVVDAKSPSIEKSEKDPADIRTDAVVAADENTSSNGPDEEEQPSMATLKLAFKKAAWYSLTLTSIVTVIAIYAD